MKLKALARIQAVETAVASILVKQVRKLICLGQTRYERGVHWLTFADGADEYQKVLTALTGKFGKPERKSSGSNVFKVGGWSRVVLPAKVKSAGNNYVMVDEN